MTLRDFISTYDFQDGQDIALIGLDRVIFVLRRREDCMRFAYRYKNRKVFRHGYSQDLNRVMVYLSPEKPPRGLIQ